MSKQRKMKGKVHWTQRPENAAKVKRIMKKASSKRREPNRKAQIKAAGATLREMIMKLGAATRRQELLAELAVLDAEFPEEK